MTFNNSVACMYSNTVHDSLQQWEDVSSVLKGESWDAGKCLPDILLIDHFLCCLCAAASGQPSQRSPPHSCWRSPPRWQRWKVVTAVCHNNSINISSLWNITGGGGHSFFWVGSWLNFWLLDAEMCLIPQHSWASSLQMWFLLAGGLVLPGFAPKMVWLWWLCDAIYTSLSDSIWEWQLMMALYLRNMCPKKHLTQLQFCTIIPTVHKDLVDLMTPPTIKP